MTNDGWAADIQQMCKESAKILSAAGLPGVVWYEDWSTREAGFLIEVGPAGNDGENRVLRIKHAMPEEEPVFRGDLSIEQLRVKQLIQVATYRGVFMASGWEVELKHGQTGPYILTKPKSP